MKLSSEELHLPWPIVQCNRLVLLMKPIRSPVKIVRMLDRRRVEHGRAVRGRHRVRVCTTVCWDVECTALSGTRGMQDRPRNHEMIANRLQGATWIQYNLFKMHYHILLISQWHSNDAEKYSCIENIPIKVQSSTTTTKKTTFHGTYLLGSLKRPPVVEYYLRDRHSCR